MLFGRKITKNHIFNTNLPYENDHILQWNSLTNNFQCEENSFAKAVNFNNKSAIIVYFYLSRLKTQLFAYLNNWYLLLFSLLWLIIRWWAQKKFQFLLINDIFKPPNYKKLFYLTQVCLWNAQTQILNQPKLDLYITQT